MEYGRVHSVELLEMALEAARRLGYHIREDTLGGFPGGACQLKGKKWLFLEPALPSRERLQLVLDVLADEPAVATLEMPLPLAKMLQRARAA